MSPEDHQPPSVPPPLPAGYRARPMADHDIDAVLELERASFPQDAWPREVFEAELARQPELTSYLIVETTGPDPQLVAYAGLQVVPPFADIQTIAVDAAHESRGLGSYLLAAHLAEAERRGAEAVLLEVREDNPRAQQLYRRFGFEQIHVRPRYYPGGVAALIMRKPLIDED